MICDVVTVARAVVIADLIIKLVNAKAVGIFNVGTELKTIYQLAKQTEMAKQIGIEIVDTDERPQWVKDMNKQVALEDFKASDKAFLDKVAGIVGKREPFIDDKMK